VKITEVRVRLVNEKNERLKAFCTMTLDNEFVIRDIKVIEGSQGLFVAMPSRKVTDRCPKCRAKNYVPAKYCNECGERLKGGRFEEAASLGDKLHTDIAHPINKECRARVQEAILAAYRAELQRSRNAAQSPSTEASTAAREAEHESGEDTGDEL